MTPNPDTFQTRRQRALESAAKLGLDALLISHAPNIRYLTGFTGDNALLLLDPSRHVLFTDPRYKFQAQQETACHVRVARGPLIPQLAAYLKQRKIRRLGIESERLSYSQFLQLDENLPDSTRLTPARRLIESLRMVKSPEELDLIRQSAQIASQALAQTLPLLRPGVTELDVSAELVYRMRKLGADGPAFDPIVAFGSNSALPHARATSNLLKTKNIILIDCGATFRGYASDMTRVLHCGAPSPAVRRLYRAVLEAQTATIESLRPGIRASQVDRCARGVLRRRGLHKAFLHATGHGLGLEIHELPRLGASEHTRLEPGMAVTIEPGVYLQELGGIRIEDTVAILQTGVEVLTSAPKDLIII